MTNKWLTQIFIINSTFISNNCTLALGLNMTTTKNMARGSVTHIIITTKILTLIKKTRLDLRQ